MRCRLPRLWRPITCKVRIIAGSNRGMRLRGPGGKGGLKLRPTSDRAREALFNILRLETLRGTLVLDLFAGTGALGLEALSRGASGADLSMTVPWL